MPRFVAVFAFSSFAYSIQPLAGLQNVLNKLCVLSV